jgi:hypothetical protein
MSGTTVLSAARCVAHIERRRGCESANVDLRTQVGLISQACPRRTSRGCAMDLIDYDQFPGLSAQERIGALQAAPVGFAGIGEVIAVVVRGRINR